MKSWVRFASVWAILCFSLLGPSYARDFSTDKEDNPFFTTWVPAGDRKRLQNLDIALEDQDGRSRVLGTLIDRPVLITFFYTRCQNARKCSMTISQLAALQRQLTRAGIHDKIRLIAITFEPQFDSPERISRFATARGLRLGEDALAIQLDSERHQELVNELLIPVSYNSGWVNTHGVEASLLDAHGRVVRKYTTVVWDNAQVMKDLKRVIAEN